MAKTIAKSALNSNPKIQPILASRKKYPGINPTSLPK
jgi:hypothetical protein